MRARATSLFLAFLLVMPASAQQPHPTAYDRAIAAGYKALTLCSAIFNAGRTQAQAEALELTGTYRDYDAILPTLTATVDQEGRRVAVPYDPAMAPRTALWRQGRGCTIQPIGWSGAAPSGGPGQAQHMDDRPWPAGDARAATRPTADRTRFEQAMNAAFDGTFGSGSRTTAVVIVQRGRIVGERYADGFNMLTSQRTWSVAKSLAGTIIGAAVQRGLIDPNRPAPVPAWQQPGDPRAAISLDQLMRMASGLHSATAGNRTDAVYFGGTAVTEETVAWPLEAPPGSRYRYANNDTMLAVHALRASLPNEQQASFPDALLFRRIGMTSTIAETDWRGDFILSSQVWSTARDLARFGLLYLNDGVWNGERILPEGWRDYVTRPSGPQPDGAFGYGATFWLMNRSEGVPPDAFAAFGNRGQYVVIVPSRDIVIVRRGEDPGGSPFEVARFAADILAALR